MTIAASCAQQRGLSGGAKDSIAPIVLTSTPIHLSTNYAGNRIELLFDEYVQLNNIQQELVISPPLQKQPKVKVRQKSILLTWDEELLPNTTYTFNFGDGIADVNEGNKAQDLKFVFSTGSVIDSLQIKGKLKDALNDTPAKAFKVMVFEDDTTIFSKKPRPLYFSKTKDDGSFTLDYMRNGQYYLYALDDVNGNYRYDESEAIAFLSNAIVPVVSDTIGTDLLASIPRPEIPVIADYDTDSTGYFRFAFDVAFYTGCRITSLSNIPMTITANEANDSLFAALQGPPTNRFEQISIGWNNLLNDTIEVPFFEEAMNKSFKIQHNISSKINAGHEVILFSNVDMKLASTSQIRLVEDSTVINAKLGSLDINFGIVATLKPGKNYDLTILPGAFQNNANGTNDTLHIQFSTYKPSDLGKLIFNLKMNEQAGYSVFILKNKSGKKIVEYPGVQSQEIIVTDLPPGEYNAWLLADSNANSLFDPANLKTKTQTEVMHVYPAAITVRANWDVKVDWEVK